MEPDDIDEVIRYLSPYSLLVMTPTRLTRIYCPFTVMALVVFESIQANQHYTVTRVNIDRDAQMVYIIKGKAYPSGYFLLML
ncbi:MAG: hypothetical protein KJ578_04555 [Bacteroidetes bacterium]|nr:hypothetical protein [Bacteroidota bacterium]MBU1578487.1 hypothetical protein [Bacteroidota bacterium]MBU2557035.1 hypothetical protein [Bacteroidota bacterium]